MHRAGIKHQAPDALSRLDTDAFDAQPLQDDLPVFSIDVTQPLEDPDLYPTADPPRDQLDVIETTVLAITPVKDIDKRAISIEELLAAQKQDRSCQRYAHTVGCPGSQFTFDHAGILTRISKIDGALQKVLPASLQPRAIYLGHYTPLSGHPGSRRMYDSLRRELYWPFMASDIAQSVKDCYSCAKTRGTYYAHQKYLQLFPPAGPLEFVAMDLLGPLPNSTRGNKHILVVTCRYSKLARTVAMDKIAAPQVAEAFLDCWIMPYGIPNAILSDNGPQFVAKFFELLCVMLGIKHLTTTAYHPETNGQAERYNRTLAARLRHFVSEHQDDWDAYIQPLTYAYNAQVHRSTNATPFSLVLSRHPPGPILEQSTDPISKPSTPERTKYVKTRMLSRIQDLMAGTDKRLESAQAAYKRYRDRKARVLAPIKPGQSVFVDRATLPKSDELPNSKLLPKTEDPYAVIGATAQTVTIDENGIQNTVSNRPRLASPVG